MKDNSIITVKSWFWDKLQDEMRRYHLLLVCEYVDADGLHMADHSKLRIDEVMAETAKAYKVAIDAEFENGGRGHAWHAWIPKSVILDAGVDDEPALVAAPELREEYDDPFTYSGLRKMVMTADSRAKVARAEEALRASDLENEQFDELMMALSFKSRELYQMDA